MRALLVLHEDTFGGATRYVMGPLETLRARGWDVHVWCAKPSPLHDEMVRRGFETDGAPRLMRYRLRSLRHPPGVRARLVSFPAALARFRRHLTELDPDVVHVNGRLALPEAVVARASGYPVVTFILDDALPGLRGGVGRVAPWIGGREVIACAHSHAESLRLGRRVPRVLYPKVDVPEEPVRRPQSPPVVGMVGWIVPRKGVDLFVDMAERLRDRDVQLRIAGSVEPGHHQEWGERQLERATRAGVKHLGRVDVPRELEEWDVLVAPSRAEPFGLMVAEAMAAGVAVVGVDHEGIGEQLRDGGGVLVEPGSGAALARAVGELLDDPQRRAALGIEAHRIARERFAGERSADALEAAWRSVQSTGTR